MTIVEEHVSPDGRLRLLMSNAPASDVECTGFCRFELDSKCETIITFQIFACAKT